MTDNNGLCDKLMCRFDGVLMSVMSITIVCLEKHIGPTCPTGISNKTAFLFFLFLFKKWILLSL